MKTVISSIRFVVRKAKKKLENKMEEKYNEEIANDICQRTLIKRERINYVIYKRIVLS